MSPFQQAVARIYQEHYAGGNYNNAGFQRWLHTMAYHPEMQDQAGRRMISAMSVGMPLGGIGGEHYISPAGALINQLSR